MPEGEIDCLILVCNMLVLFEMLMYTILFVYSKSMVHGNCRKFKQKANQQFKKKLLYVKLFYYNII